MEKDIDLSPFITADDPTDCTLVVVGGKFLRRLPEVLKRIDGDKGFIHEDESRGPDAAIRKNVKFSFLLHFMQQ